MPNYQTLYTHLFNAVTDALEELEQMNVGAAKARLIAAQQQSEEDYIAEEDHAACVASPCARRTQRRQS